VLVWRYVAEVRDLANLPEQFGRGEPFCPVDEINVFRQAGQGLFVIAGPRTHEFGARRRSAKRLAQGGNR